MFTGSLFCHNDSFVKIPGTVKDCHSSLEVIPRQSAHFYTHYNTQKQPKSLAHFSSVVNNMSTDHTSIEWQKENVELGIIGMGDMGRMYASKLSQIGWKK